MLANETMCWWKLNLASYIELIVDHYFTQESENTSASCDPLGKENSLKCPLTPYVDAFFHAFKNKTVVKLYHLVIIWG